MNWRKIRFKDLISPRKWWIVIDAYKNKALGVSLERCQQAVEMKYTHGEATADFWARRVMGKGLDYAEVVVLRATLCHECVKQGSCVHCGCSAPENMYSLKNECSAGNWGAEY